jgi:bifunctional non-homologous end joining protein LigD
MRMRGVPRCFAASAKLASWPKTTGGKGVHIVVPIEPSADWAQCLEFSRAFAEVMTSERPGDSS